MKSPSSQHSTCHGVVLPCLVVQCNKRIYLLLVGSLVLFDLLSMQGVSQPAAVQQTVSNTVAASVRASTPASDVTSERSTTATPVVSGLFHQLYVRLTRVVSLLL